MEPIVARKEEYHAPIKDAPKVGGAAAIVSIVGVVLILLFTFGLVVSGILQWYVAVFFALAGATLVALSVWLTKLSSYRQGDVDIAHKKDFLAENARWIEHVVIPKIKRDTSVELSIRNATQLVYTGTIRIKLDKPYQNKLHDLTFKVDAKNNPIVSIHHVLDGYYPEGSPTELVANVPYRAKRRCILVKKAKRPVEAA